jgi:hypothetical protein
MRIINRTALAKKHRGKWLALKSDRRSVIATGTTPTQVWEAARRKGVRKPVITRMPNEVRSFVGGYRLANDA